MSNLAHKRARLLALSLVALLILLGCNQRMGVSWASMSLVNTAQDILVSYEEQMVLVSRTNGFVVTRDLQGTTTARDSADAWRINGRDVDAEFYTTPLFFDYAGERLMLVADYNRRLLTINFNRTCFANRVGACVGQDPPYVELPGRVLANMGQDESRIYVPLSDEDGVVAYNKGLYEEGWDIDDADERRRRFDETLTVAWTFETERGVWAQPIALNGAVFIPAMDHRLYRVDAETGEELARLELGGALASGVVVHDRTPATDFDDLAGPPEDAEINLETARLYAGTFGRKIFQIPLDFETGMEDRLPVFEANNWVWGAPKIVDNTLYAADLGGYVYAIDVSDDEFRELWRVQTEIGGIRATPLVTENHVIVASREGQVMWLRREDGSTFTQQDVRDEVLSELMLIPGDENRETLIIVSTVRNSRIMVAFTLDGAPRWTYPSS